MTTASAATKPQIRLDRRSPAYWRVTIDNPPINVMGPEMVGQFQAVMDALEADADVRVVVFDSAVDDYFLNHSDFTGKLEDLTSMPAGPTGLPPWPDFLVRLTRLPVASIALTTPKAAVSSASAVNRWPKLSSVSTPAKCPRTPQIFFANTSAAAATPTHSHASRLLSATASSAPASSARWLC